MSTRHYEIICGI